MSEDNLSLLLCYIIYSVTFCFLVYYSNVRFKTAFINLGILLLYSGFFFYNLAYNSEYGSGLVWLVYLVFFIGFHWLINLFTIFVIVARKKSPTFVASEKSTSIMNGIRSANSKEKRNFFFLLLIVAGVLMAGAGFIMSQFNWNTGTGDDLVRSGLALGELSGFFLLLLNGTFIKTVYFKRMKAAFAIIIIGVLLKILHLKFAYEILSLGFFVMILIYFFSFLNKPIKRGLDYIKLGWVVVAFAGGNLALLHYITYDYQILSSVLMWLAIIDYWKLERKKRALAG